MRSIPRIQNPRLACSFLTALLLVVPAISMLAEAQPVEAEPRTLPLRELHRGYFLNLSDAYFVLEDDATYKAFALQQMGASKPPTVDFATERVLVAALGHSSGACGFGVSRVEARALGTGESLVAIDVAMGVPITPFVCPSEHSFSAHVVAIPKEAGLHVFKDALTQVPLGHQSVE